MYVTNTNNNYNTKTIGWAYYGPTLWNSMLHIKFVIRAKCDEYYSIYLYMIEKLIDVAVKK